MDAEVNELLRKAMTLPSAARAALAGRLLESLDEGVDEGVEAAWDEEIARRIRELDSGVTSPIPWSEVRRRLSGK